MGWEAVNKDRRGASDSLIERAVRMRTEDGLKHDEIARRLSTPTRPISTHTVGRWMQKAGVARARGKHPAPEPRRQPDLMSQLDACLSRALGRGGFGRLKELM